MSSAYGLGWREFLQEIGLKSPARLRSVSTCPPWPWLLALEEQTGVGAAFMRDHMTFEQLSTQMTWLVHRGVPCELCRARQRLSGSRQVEWLDDLAPWQLICDRHPCPVLASEVGSRRLRDIIGRDVRALRYRLRSAACSDFLRPFPAVPLSAAACIEMVKAINNRLRLGVWMRNSGHAAFVVHDTLMAPQVNETSCPWPRNSRAVSAWYAWYVLAWPEVALHRHTQCRDPDQTHDLLAVLFDFRHIGIHNDQWEYALGLCARAEADPNSSDEERQQVHRLHHPRFRSLMATSPAARIPDPTRMAQPGRCTTKHFSR